jgi:hypothetical protein
MTVVCFEERRLEVLMVSIAGSVDWKELLSFGCTCFSTHSRNTERPPPSLNS